MFWTVIAWTSGALWLFIFLLPFRPWSTRESLDAETGTTCESLDDITVIIPARNEAENIAATMAGLKAQGERINIVLVDDQSTDDTAKLARQHGPENLRVLPGKPLPAGWTGKLWAQEQGRLQVSTEHVLLLDADIRLEPGILAALTEKIRDKKLDFLSLMAVPHMKTFWEKLLMPAFVYFFKLLYPFRLSNSGSRLVAAAAGGCILVRNRVLTDIGGFGALKDALIDDCSLARKVKSRGFRTWMGLTHSVKSIRPYGGLMDIWNMVARTAFTQLKYSLTLLMVCTLLMAAAYIAPVTGLFSPLTTERYIAAAALILMALTMLPTLRYYRRSPLWALLMPIAGMLYLAMTWSSAIRYRRGERSRWRGRSYDRQLQSDK